MQTRNKKSEKLNQNQQKKAQFVKSSPQMKFKNSSEDKQVQCSSSSIQRSIEPFSFKSHFETRKQQIRKHHKYVLDLFQINDIYHFHQISISGIVRQYEQTYALVAVKILETLQDILCIAFLKQNIPKHNQKLLQKIESENEVMGLFDLEGKNLDNLWLDQLPDQSRI